MAEIGTYDSDLNDNDAEDEIPMLVSEEGEPVSNVDARISSLVTRTGTDGNSVIRYILSMKIVSLCQLFEKW